MKQTASITTSIVIALGLFTTTTECVRHVVFVHGTVTPLVFAVTNPFGVYKHTYAKDSAYVQTIQCVRADKRMYDSQVMLEPGFRHIDLAKLEENKRFAAYQLAHALSELEPNIEQRFYAFGWSGELSLQARKAAAKDLYNALNRLAKGPEDIIEVLAHSHGGNVVAHLVDHAQDSSELIIDHLILLGTPIQTETVHKFENPMFRMIWHTWSKGDGVAGRDTISTASRRSDRTILEHLNTQTPNRIHEIDLRVENKSCFGHRSFFYFGMNSIPQRLWRRKHHQTLRSIRLLPVAALIPLLHSVVPLAERNSSFIANLRKHDDQIVMELTNDQTQATSSSYHVALEKLDRHLTQSWKPIAYRKEAAKSVHALTVALNHRLCCCCLPSAEEQSLYSSNELQG